MNFTLFVTANLMNVFIYTVAFLCYFMTYNSKKIFNVTKRLKLKSKVRQKT